jgi:serine/threonine protein kinase
MPPEAFNKKPTVSPATDIWAVAVIFQELLTGKLPFSQSEIPSLMYSILHDEPNEMPADVPASLKAIVRKALQKSREDRFSSALEMIEALKEFQGGRLKNARSLPKKKRRKNLSDSPLTIRSLTTALRKRIGF